LRQPHPKPRPGASSPSPPPHKAYKDLFSKSLDGLMSYTESIRWLPNFICFIGSGVKTFIYFYRTYGLGEFLLLKMKFLRKFQKFGFTASYNITFGFRVCQRELNDSEPHGFL
jgi:hypothetical protein